MNSPINHEKAQGLKSPAAVVITDALTRLHTTIRALNEVASQEDSPALRRAAELLGQVRSLIAAERAAKPHLQETFGTSREEFVELIAKEFGSPDMQIERREVPGGFDHVLRLSSFSLWSMTYLRPLYPSFAVTRTICPERPGTIVVVANPENFGCVQKIVGGIPDFADFLAAQQSVTRPPEGRA